MKCPKCKERVPPLNFCDHCGARLDLERPAGGGQPIRHIGEICPHCQAPIRILEKMNMCAVCGTAHHRQCWKKAGGCSTLGCRGYPAIGPETRTEGSR